MAIGAIVVLGESGSVAPDAACNGGDELARESVRSLADGPIASLEVLGQSALQRTIQYLQRAGVETVSLVANGNSSHLTAASLGTRVRKVPVQHSTDIWPATRHTVGEYVKNGSEMVVVVRLGAYIEFDFVDLAQFHREKARPVTRITDGQGPLDLWLVDAARCSKAGISFGEVAGGESDAHVAAYSQARYVNRLASAGDLRRFVVDVFLSRCSARPTGDETKPGVWVDRSAQVDPRARIVAPAYIGPGTKIRVSALITRFSNVERGCDIDCGTVVEDSSILANTYLGAWLDVSHAVVCGSNLTHLHRKVTIEVKDRKLLGRTTPGYWRRAVAGMSAQ